MAHNQPLGATEVDRAMPLAATEAARAMPLAATEVDRRLRKALRELQLAERNSVLWFAEVLKRKLFKDLGYSSVYQYAGEALGFSRPRTAQFIRLCESLEGLPALKDSVAAGDVSWTKAREVAKVATPQTETAWVDLARVESRRKLERRVRMAQTHSRARRRHGGRQLGLADSGAPPAGNPRAIPAGNPSAIPADPSHATQAGSPDGLQDDRSNAIPADFPGAIPASPLGAQALRGAGEAMPLDVAFAEVPVTLSLRFTPEQYARYEAILEQLRKHGERSPREELILAGMEALLVEAGSGAADPVSGREAKSSAVRGGEAVSQREAGSSARGGKAVSPREARSAARGEGAASARIAKSTAAPKMTPASPRDRESDPSTDSGKVSPRNFKPVYQIVVQQCEDCGRARVQTSRGAKLIDPAAAEAMRCDARILRPSDESHSCDQNHPAGRSRAGGRNRATIPPSVRRAVMARDGHRCRAPGCGSARFLEVHHVVSRAEGGSNRPDNLVTLCSACHRLAHSHPHHGGPIASGLSD